ncbi:MAG TPA: LysR family transcriptional regulator [Gammaproteobacteria bacterium]|nr:LysR family transcriptional regulator [Gammaproteobacteria bacterium]
MHFTLRQLKVFHTAARHLSFTRAAEELHLTQPAVSMQIKQLENSAELPLFEQLGKKIYLTAAGKELFDYARNILLQLEEMEQVLEQMRGVRAGRLDISVATTANYFATWLLAEFSQNHPDVTIKLDVTNRAGLLQQLEHNDKDLVIMGRPPEQRDLVAEPFMDNPLVIIAAPGHPLCGEERIPLQRLQGETFVVREQASGTRSAMERFFSTRDITLNTGMEMTSNEAIKQAVEAGLGLGIVSVHTVKRELEAGHLVTLNAEEFPILRHWYVVYRRGKRLSPAARRFREFVLRRADHSQYGTMDLT